MPHLYINIIESNIFIYIKNFISKNSTLKAMFIVYIYIY